MRLLPHEIPKSVIREPQSAPKPEVGKGNTQIDWEHFAPLVHGKTPAEARRIIGCSLSAVQNSRDKGWIHLVSSEPKRIDWSQYKELAKEHTTYGLSRITGIHVRRIQEAQKKGLIQCKAGQPNGWTKR